MTIFLYKNKNIVVVVCVENIETTGLDGRIIRIGVIGTNVF